MQFLQKLIAVSILLSTLETTLYSRQEPSAQNSSKKQNRCITFVTGNEDKFQEVKKYLNELDSSIVLERVALDLPEYQGLDIKKIALAKAQEAWRLLQKPVLIDDGGIYLERYNNFPGPLIKYVLQGIGLEGFWLLAKDDPRAYFLSCLIYYYEPDKYELFEGTCYGTIIKPCGAVSREQMPFSDIFIPQGTTKTLTQMRGTEEECSYHHRYKALKQFVQWLCVNSTH